MHFVTIRTSVASDRFFPTIEQGDQAIKHNKRRIFVSVLLDFIICYVANSNININVDLLRMFVNMSVYKQSYMLVGMLV